MKCFFSLSKSRKKMSTNLIKLYALLLLALSNDCLNSNNFCKLAAKHCTKRNTPHVYACGASMCTRNKTDCREYLQIESKIRDNHLKAGIRIALMAHIANYNEIKLAEGFMRFKKTIKKCTEIAYQWQPNDICIKGRNCLHYHFI